MQWVVTTINGACELAPGLQAPFHDQVRGIGSGIIEAVGLCDSSDEKYCRTAEALAAQYVTTSARSQ